MPIGKVRWYDRERGFGFVSNPGGEDVYVGRDVLPDGVEELHKGQRIEYDYADGRPGPQALRVAVPPEPTAGRGERARGRGGRPGGGGRGAAGARRTPAELSSMISDVISMLEEVQGELGRGGHADRRHARQVAEVLRAIARDLDR